MREYIAEFYNTGERSVMRNLANKFGAHLLAPIISNRSVAITMHGLPKCGKIGFYEDALASIVGAQDARNLANAPLRKWVTYDQMVFRREDFGLSMLGHEPDPSRMLSKVSSYCGVYPRASNGPRGMDCYTHGGLIQMAASEVSIVFAKRDEPASNCQYYEQWLTAMNAALSVAPTESASKKATRHFRWLSAGKRRVEEIRWDASTTAAIRSTIIPQMERSIALSTDRRLDISSNVIGITVRPRTIEMMQAAIKFQQSVKDMAL